MNSPALNGKHFRPLIYSTHNLNNSGDYIPTLLDIMMKKLFLFGVISTLCLVLVVDVLLDSERDIDQHLTAKNTASATVDDTLLSTKATENWLAFDFQINTYMLNAANQVLSNSEFSGSFALKQTEQREKWQGQVLTASVVNKKQLPSSAKNHFTISAPVPFITTYDNRVFSEINLLGLSTNHPISALQHILPNLSYQLDSPLVISNATANTSYQYQQIEQHVYRQVHEQSLKYIENAPTIVNVEEQWRLTLDDLARPSKMDSKLVTYYQSPNGDFTVKQTLSVIATAANTSNIALAFANAAFNENQNIGIQASIAQETNIIIDSEEALMHALLKFKSLPDDALAKAIGLYIIEHYTTDEIATLLNSPHSIDNVASLMIYSIQKVATFAAEVALVELLSHPDLLRENKQRVIISLGRFEALSELGFQHLTQTSQAKDKQLANLALLSVGTVARFNQSHQPNVKNFLSQTIADEANNAIAWLAINNSGSTQFNEQAATTLGKNGASVDVALIKLLANDSNYHDKIIDFALDTNNAKAVNEVARAIANNKLELSLIQKHSVKQKIEMTDDKLLKDQLTKLVNTQRKNW